MTAVFYPLWKRALETGAANADLDEADPNNGYYAVLINTALYTFSALHEFYTSLAGVLGADQLITPVTITNSTTDGGDVTFSTVSAGSPVGAIVTYRRNAGANSTWRLVSYYDTPGGGLPFVANGGPITVQWNSVGIHTL